MSSRALKRLQQQQLEQQAQELDQDSDLESIPDSSSKAQNLFDLVIVRNTRDRIPSSYFSDLEQLNAGDDDANDDADNAISEEERPVTPPPVRNARSSHRGCLC